MSRADIKASRARLRPTFDFPVVAPSAAPRGQVSAGRPAATAVTPAETSKGQSESTKAVGAGTPWRHVTLGQLIDAGLIRVPLDVSRHYRGTDLAARIESADRIVFNGTAFESLSIAGGMGRLSVVGPTPRHPYPPTNGCTFWEVRAADGSRRQLDTLRRELHERKVVSLEGRRTG